MTAIVEPYSKNHFILLDFCSFVTGVNNKLVIKWLLDIYAETLPRGILHRCPYFGLLEAYNLTMNLTKFPITGFLLGRYQGKIRFFNGNDENMFTLIHKFELKAINNDRKTPILGLT